MAKFYYLKYNVEIGEIVLDISKKKVSSKELLVLPNRITQKQGLKLRERITDRFLYKDRKAFISEVEYEFKRLFSICTECGFVTDKDKVNKAWKGLCRSCFKEYQQEKVKDYQSNKDYLKKVRKLKEYLKTEQGQIDAVPGSVIESNVRMAVVRTNKTMREVAKHLNISDKQMSILFNNKRIDADILRAICEYLMTPLERMLRPPRGVRIKRKDGVPKFWLDEDFRIKNE